LLLKNALIQRTGPAVNERDASALAYVKSTVLLGLAEPEAMIRHTAGTVVMSLLYNEDTGAWPEALDALAKGMASQDENLVEVSFELPVASC
jgi:transportin-1